jgi:hypothetical protein
MDLANQHTVEEEVHIPDVQALIQKVPSTKHPANDVRKLPSKGR